MVDDTETMDVDGEVLSREPKSSRPWLALITEAEKAFKSYQDKCDGIDKRFADLDRMAEVLRDREFQLFWANVQVLGPSIYSRPPVPVVVPRFKDRRPLPRTASEMLERCAISAFDSGDIDSVMREIRDDLNISARGAAWLRYETREDSDTDAERVCIEHLDRKDFLHEPARKWAEVDWVARRGWLTKKEMRKRFRKTSGDAYQDAAYNVRKDDRNNGAADNSRKAGVWEIWCKSQNKVVWVTEGVEVVLDEDEPHLKLEGFFPCPKPAYATTQRRSLIPVPDYLFYKDQIEEINDLTDRIHALADAVQVKGFYPAGTPEIGDAIEAALKNYDNTRVVVPVSNWAAFGNTAPKDTIVWLPTDMVVATITQCVELRRQLIDDVYQITGLSDIMRGQTAASETATAQQLKSQYGSIRIRDKQEELVRIARDITRISAEIMAENFSEETLLKMSQLELPTEKDLAAQVEQIQAQAQQQAQAAAQEQIQQQLAELQQDPEALAMAQQNPQQVQQIQAQIQEQATAQAMAEAQPQIEEVMSQPSVEAVIKFLRDNKLRPFVLDIETDSTIQPDEDAAKQRANEFITAIGGLLAQAIPAVKAVPQTAGLMAQTLKYAASQFRAGREMDTAIDEFADQMAQMAGQQQGNPEAEAAQAQMQAEQQRMQMEMQMKQAEIEGRQQEAQLKAQIEQQKAQAEIEAKAIEAQTKQAESDAKLQQITAQMERDAQKGALELQKLQMEIERMQVDAALKVTTANQQAEQSERAFEQKSALAAQQAAQKQQQAQERP